MGRGGYTRAAKSGSPSARRRFAASIQSDIRHHPAACPPGTGWPRNRMIGLLSQIVEQEDQW